MPKPNAKQLQNFKQFQRRQLVLEKRYTKPFFQYLRSCYFSAARQYLESGTFTVDNTKLNKILTRLYTQTTLTEAKHEYLEVIAPLEEGNRLKEEVTQIQTKDFIDDILGILSPKTTGLIYLWRSLLDVYLEVRLTNRIALITRTTEERIAKIIQQSMFEGLGQEEIARKIRKEGRGEINIHRARNIARTETLVAANQGKYMAADSSSLEMKKKWIPRKDDRTRQSHIDMLNAKWIPLKNDFWIGTTLGFYEPAKYPGDERLSAENVVNCRCAMVTEAVRDENGNLVRKGTPINSSVLN